MDSRDRIQALISMPGAEQARINILFSDNILKQRLCISFFSTIWIIDSCRRSKQTLFFCFYCNTLIQQTDQKALVVLAVKYLGADRSERDGPRVAVWRGSGGATPSMGACGENFTRTRQVNVENGHLRGA